MSSGKIEQRMAAVLLILMESYGTSIRDGMQVSVPLTRQDLSKMAGITVETAIRILSKWQKQGILRTDRNLLTIHQPALLSDTLIAS